MKFTSKYKQYLIIALLTGGAFLWLNGNSMLVSPAETSPIPSATPSAPVPSGISSPPTPSVQIGNITIPVEIATGVVAQQKGLSGRASLDQSRGMLFIFPKAGRYRFWMPDMHFPIDIIWIQNGHVAGITANVSNDFDPVHPRFYTLDTAVQYVLEVNAGFAKRHNIAVADPVTLPNIE